MTVDEYHIGQLYAVMHASAKETGGDTAVEIVENRPFTDEMDMASGQYTYKIYHIEQRLPRILRALGPKSMMLVEERAWSSYPDIYMVITNPLLGSRLEIAVRSAHLPDRGTTENVFNLSPQQLKERQVVVLDIGKDCVNDSHTKDADAYNPAEVVSKKTGRGPLVGNWIAAAEPVMCAYKLISIKCAIFGIQGRIEKLLDGVEHGLYLRFHKQIFTLLDEWFGMSLEDIRREEDRLKAQLDEKLGTMDLATRTSAPKPDHASSETTTESSECLHKGSCQVSCLKQKAVVETAKDDDKLPGIAADNTQDEKAAH